jgi:hypothetical protein
MFSSDVHLAFWVTLECGSIATAFQAQASLRNPRKTKKDGGILDMCGYHFMCVESVLFSWGGNYAMPHALCALLSIRE